MRDFLLDEDENSKTSPSKSTIECPELECKLLEVLVKILLDTGSKLTCMSSEFYDLHSAEWKMLPRLPVVGVHAIGFVGEKSCEK